MLEPRALEVVKSERGDIVKIASKRCDLDLAAQETYLNAVKPLSVKGWIKHSEADLVLVAIDSGLELWQSTEAEPLVGSMRVDFFQYSRVTVAAGSWFAVKNLRGRVARFLVFSSLFHGEDLVDRRDFLS